MQVEPTRIEQIIMIARVGLIILYLLVMFIQESENKRNHSIIMQQFDNQLPISSLDQTTEGTKQSNPTSCTLDHWGATSTHMWDKFQNNHAGSTNQNRTNNHPYLEASEIF